ncbi:hypothetical protein ACPOL_0642 [Acidisarcina polymorpha]|uniref:Uncharacterized protein n=1 Tax=Acidisarcina polymorpha TaxID=2211140 RepID=A0A2Z5FT39_9BACT|nr:hypothetical protein ACPOL_0642 [Acidisarcina polymorpha]
MNTDFQMWVQGKANRVENLDQNGVNVRGLSDLQKRVGPVATGLRRLHGSLAVSERNSGMFDVGSPRVSQLHLFSITLEKCSPGFALCALNAPAQPRL